MELQRTDEQVQAFREALRRGDGICAALLAAGYSESVANRGINAVPEGLMPYLVERGYSLMSLGKVITTEQQEALIRGRLATNLIDGKDSAVNSSKLFGQDKRLNMWSNDSIAGAVLIEFPQPQQVNITVQAGAPELTVSNEPSKVIDGGEIKLLE